MAFQICSKNIYIHDLVSFLLIVFMKPQPQYSPFVTKHQTIITTCKYFKFVDKSTGLYNLGRRLIYSCGYANADPDAFNGMKNDFIRIYWLILCCSIKETILWNIMRNHFQMQSETHVKIVSVTKFNHGRLHFREKEKRQLRVKFYCIRVFPMYAVSQLDLWTTGLNF